MISESLSKLIEVLSQSTGTTAQLLPQHPGPLPAVKTPTKTHLLKVVSYANRGEPLSPASPYEAKGP